jgi:hypothetical protein
MTITIDRPTNTDISLDIDLSLLVGEMEDQECEHSQHKKGLKTHGIGPATHYIKTIHGCQPGLIYAACNRFAMHVKAGAVWMRCGMCDQLGYASEFLEVVGKVGE